MTTTPVHVTSLSDPRVDIFRNIRDKDLRGRERLFMGESERVLRRLLLHPERIHALFLSRQRFDSLAGELAVLPNDVEIFVGDLETLSGVAGFHIHRGVLVAGRRLHPSELRPVVALAHLAGKKQLRLLVAEGVTSVDNMGSLFRNAAAFNLDGVVLSPDCCDPLYRKAIRVSVGHVLSMPYAICRNWPEDLLELRRVLDMQLVAAECVPGALHLREVQWAPRAGVMVGSESHGLSDVALDASDCIASIPMSGGVPSLNVSVASAVMLYQWLGYGVQTVMHRNGGGKPA